ncbi:MAG: hypothetical protein NT098_04000 [Candidatus Parcubacteria bacterium]|nr:hypothetical protein [Candidatus Parcubacteria bacterium]
MPPSNSFEKLEGDDFAHQERGLFEYAENKKAAMVMELVTRRLMENAG